MKTKFILILLLFQNQIFAQKLVVQSTYTNVLYLGVDNELVIRYKGVKDEDLLVKGSNGCEISHVKEATYISTVNDGLKRCKIYVGLKKDIGLKWLDSVEFEINALGNVKAQFGNLEGEKQAVEDLVMQDSIQLKTDGYYKGYKSRIIKYSVIILPKIGPLSEYSVKGSKISDIIRNALSLLNEGDIILIDRIRAIGPAGERPLNPITIVIHSNSTPNYFEGNRIEGYHRDSLGILKIFRFPVSNNQVNGDCGLKKDSIWKYWKYNFAVSDYQLYRKDSFSNGRLVVSTFFNDTNGRKMYQIRPFTDSTSLYVSYYLNGDIYQKGLVRMNTRKIEFSKSMFYNNGQSNSKKQAWHLCLNETPDYLFPVGEWKVYDSNKKLQMVVNYAKFINSNIGCRTDPEWPWLEYYYIAPHGECLLYKNGKLSETILFKEGVMESRQIER